MAYRERSKQKSGIGAMRHVATIETPTRTQDAAGGFSSSWDAITNGTNIFGALQPISVYEIERYNHSVGKVSHRFSTRAGALGTITNKMRLTYAGRVFAISGALPLDERGEYIDIMLDETISGGATDGVDD